jgi:hypothetical protein
MDVMKELEKLTIRKPLSEAQVRDIVGAPEQDDGQFDEEGFCAFCGDHESKSYHYKCWR